MGIAIGLNLALFLFLPKLAALFVERQIESLGFTNVNVEFDYPGVQQTVIPLITLKKDLGGETASLTLRGLTLNYHLPDLALGFLEEVGMEELQLEILGEPHPSAPPLSEPPQPKAVATPLALLFQQQIEWPLGKFTVGHATIFREQATGPLRRLTMSGEFINTQGMLHGSLTFKGERGKAYRLEADLTPQGEIRLVLDAPSGSSNPLLDMDSLMEISEESGLKWEGTLHANLKRAAPFLAWLLPLGKDLDGVDGHLALQWNGSTSHLESVEGLFRDLSSHLHVTFQGSATLPAWGEHIEAIEGTVGGTLTATPGEVNVMFSPITDLSARLDSQHWLLNGPLSQTLFRETEPARLHFNDTGTFRLFLDHDPLSWTINGPIHLHVGDDGSPLSVETQLTTASGDFMAPLSTQASLQFHIQGSLPILEFDSGKAHNVSGIIMGQLDLTNQTIHIQVSDQSSLNTGLLHIDQIQAPTFTLQPRRAVDLHYDFPLQSGKIGPITANLDLPRVNWAGHSLSTSKIAVGIEEVSLQDNTWNGKGTVTIHRLQTTLKKVVPPPLNLAVGFHLNEETVKAGILLETIDKRMRIKGRLAHHFLTNYGTFHATLVPLTFSPSTVTLREMLKPWNHPFDLTTGRLGAAIRCGWKPSRPPDRTSLVMTRADLTLQLERIGGYYEHLVFDDLNSTLTITANDWNNFATSSPSQVSIQRIEAGIGIENVHFGLHIHQGGGDAHPIVDLREVTADLLGGHISSTRIYVDPNRLPASFTLKLENIQLSQLLELEQQKGLQGSGSLDGVIPITLTDQSIEIHQGWVEARPPGGVIQFRPSEGTGHALIQQTPHMEIVLQSLRNFHYDVLRAEVEYKADGTLNLATRLEGRNPDLKNSRPVHFNLHVEEHIPSLLKTLRMMKGIEEQLDEYFRYPIF